MNESTRNDCDNMVGSKAACACFFFRNTGNDFSEAVNTTLTQLFCFDWKARTTPPRDTRHAPAVPKRSQCANGYLTASNPRTGAFWRLSRRHRGRFSSQLLRDLGGDFPAPRRAHKKWRLRPKIWRVITMRTARGAPGKMATASRWAQGLLFFCCCSRMIEAGLSG